MSKSLLITRDALLAAKDCGKSAMTDEQYLLFLMGERDKLAERLRVSSEHLATLCRLYGYAHGYRTALSPEQVRRLIDDKHKRERMQ